MKTMLAAILMTMLIGCTGSVIRTTAFPSFDPMITARVKVVKKNDTVSAIYNGESKLPKAMTNSIPYWVIENGKARVEHIYFKPLYIVVN
jgi:negative regulator of replication initiation